MSLRMIISGGQSGSDTIGLIAARMTGILTGGCAPKGYRTENGAKYELRDVYNLTEHESWRYEPRTEVNVENSDATLIFGDVTSVGTKLTLKLLHKHEKPYLCNPTADQIIDFVRKEKIEILNIAGNRGSKIPDKRRFEIGKILLIAFRKLKETIT